MHNLTEADSFDAAVGVLDDGIDTPDAANLNVAPQSLANRTRYLLNRSAGQTGSFPYFLYATYKREVTDDTWAVWSANPAVGNAWQTLASATGLINAGFPRVNAGDVLDIAIQVTSDKIELADMALGIGVSIAGGAYAIVPGSAKKVHTARNALAEMASGNNPYFTAVQDSAATQNTVYASFNTGAFAEATGGTVIPFTCGSDALKVNDLVEAELTMGNCTITGTSAGQLRLADSQNGGGFVEVPGSRIRLNVTQNPTTILMSRLITAAGLYVVHLQGMVETSGGGNAITAEGSVSGKLRVWRTSSKGGPITLRAQYPCPSGVNDLVNIAVMGFADPVGLGGSIACNLLGHYGVQVNHFRHV